MKTRTLITLVVGLPFAAFSTWVTLTQGYIAIFEVATLSPAAAQVFADLGVSLMLLLTYIGRECRERGEAVWPWVLATLALGSLAPLAYFGWRAVAEREGTALAEA